ncbi:MAG: hypothetical protein ACLGGV_03110 [Bacteroidia bacterium]
MFKQFLGLVFFLSVAIGNAQQYNQIFIDSNSTDDFSLIEKEFKDKRVVMLGENHLFRKSNYKLEFKILKHLNKHYGIDHLLLEFGYSIGWLADTYIQTGDTAIKEVVKDYFYPEFQALFDSIRTLNLSLDTIYCPQVRITSIDIERSIPIAVKVASMLLPSDSIHAHDSINFHIETIRSLASYSDRLIKKSSDNAEVNVFSSGFYEDFNFYSSIKPIIANVKKYEAHYRAYLGEDCEHFFKIFEGLDKAEQWNDYLNSRAIQYVILREEYLYNSFIKYLHDNPEAKVLMQFGRCHTIPDKTNSNCAFDAFKSLAYRIKHSNNSEIKGKIFTLPIVYLNSYADGFSDDYTVGKHLVDSLTIEDADGKLFLVKKNEQDSLIEEHFPGFDFFVLNTNNSSDDQIIDTTEENYEDEYYQPEQFVFDLGVESGFTGYSTSFSEFTRQLNLSQNFSPIFRYTNLFFDFQDDEGFVGMNVFFTPKQNIRKDSASYSLSVFGGSFKVGKQFISMNKKGIVVLAIGNGYYHYTMGESIDLNWKSNSIFDNASNNQNRRIIRNPAYVLSIDSKAKYKLGGILLGISAGYNFDFSSKKWKNSGGFISDGPRNSLSGWYAGFSLSFKLNSGKLNDEYYYY